MTRRFRIWWNSRWLEWRLRHGFAQRGRTVDTRPAPWTASDGAMEVKMPGRVRMEYQVIRADGSVEPAVVFKDGVEDLPPDFLAALESAAKGE